MTIDPYRVALQALIDAFPFYVLVVDEFHQIVLANDKVNSAAAVLPETICGTFCPQTMHGLDVPFPGCPLDDAIGTGRSASKELYDPESRRWMKTGVFPFSLPGSDGQTLYLHFAEDVTGRKAAEERDRRNADMLRVSNEVLAASHSPIPTDALLRRTLDLLLSIPWLSVESRGAIFLCDDEGTTLQMRASRGLSGEIVNACRGVPWGRCLCGRAAQQGVTQHASEMDERHEVTYPGIADHGHYCVPIRSPDRLWGVINLYLRVGHERIEEEVAFLEAVGATLAMVLAHRSDEQTKSRLNTMLDATTDFVGTADPQGRTLWVNAGGRTMAGVGPDEDVRGVPIGAFHSAEALRIVEEIGIPHAIAHGTWEGETAILHRAGRETPVSQVILAHRDANGAVAYLSTIARDLSARKSLEAQLRQAQKLDAVGQLAAGVAHDFNNLLSVIITSGGFLLDDLPADSPSRRDAVEILQAGQRAAELTRQLLLFSRNQQADVRVIEVDSTVRNLARMLNRLIGEHISLELRLDSAGCCTRIDPGQLEQVLTNLAINARDAMTSGGRLSIATRTRELGEGEGRQLAAIAPGRYLELEVTDTGVGMTSDVLERVFEPFFTTKPAGKGTGLGLSMAYGVITQQGGHIAVESEPGVGTTVRLLLKQAELDADQPKARKSSGPPAAAATLLLVEDDEAVRRVTARLLTAVGYRVIEAFDGEEGLRLFAARREEIGAVVTDMVMPVMGGVEMARRMAELQPRIKVVFTSGYPDAAAARGPLAAFDSVVIPKPVERRALYAALKKLIGRG